MLGHLMHVLAVISTLSFQVKDVNGLWQKVVALERHQAVYLA